MGLSGRKLVALEGLCTQCSSSVAWYRRLSGMGGGNDGESFRKKIT